MSSPAVPLIVKLTTGFKFDPSDEQLIEAYLLPRVRGELDRCPGIIIEDDSAANTNPSKLPKDLKVYSTCAPSTSGRPDRRCDGGGTWVSQGKKKESDKELVVSGGEKINWTKRNLNLRMEENSGSCGWVMHEYFINASPSLKIYSISFTGHGQKRKRAAEDDGADEPEAQHLRVDVASAVGDSGFLPASGSGTTTATTTPDQDSDAAPAQQQHRHASPEDDQPEMTSDAGERRIDQVQSAAQTSEVEETTAMMTDVEAERYVMLYEELLMGEEQSTAPVQTSEHEGTPTMNPETTDAQAAEQYCNMLLPKVQRIDEEPSTAHTSEDEADIAAEMIAEMEDPQPEPFYLAPPVEQQQIDHQQVDMAAAGTLDNGGIGSEGYHMTCQTHDVPPFFYDVRTNAGSVALPDHRYHAV